MLFEKTETLELKVEGMSCGHCQKRVTDALSGLKGVKNVVVSLEQKSAVVQYQPSKVDRKAMVEAVNALGFQAE